MGRLAREMGLGSIPEREGRVQGHTTKSKLRRKVLCLRCRDQPTKASYAEEYIFYILGMESH